MNVPGNNAANQATIGEFATYTVTYTIPEGTTPSALVVDNLNAGLAFVDVTGAVASPGLNFTSGVGFGLPTLGNSPANTSITNNGRTITFNFGTITNFNVNNGQTETITITYRVVVLNTNAGTVDNTNNLANNQAGQQRQNSARFSWTGNPTTLSTINGGQATGTDGTRTNVNGGTGGDNSSTPIDIVEPVLTIVKDVRNVTQSQAFGAVGSPQTTRADLNDTIEYRLTIVNPTTGSTRANDVTLNDPLPTTFFLGTFSVTSVCDHRSGAGVPQRRASDVDRNRLHHHRWFADLQRRE